MENWQYKKLEEADVNKDGKLASQWAKEGYVVKQRRKGHVRWSSWWFKEKLFYFDAEDVKFDPDAASAYLQKIKSERRLAARNKKKANIKGWRKALKRFRRILFFKVETSGLDPICNDVLAISWQLVDALTFKIIGEKTVYFEQIPERTDGEAIDANGLTVERLTELGTVSRTEGFRAFAEAWRRAGLIVAQNVSFHLAFIKGMSLSEGLALPEKAAFCTMEDTSIYKKGSPTMETLAAAVKVPWDGDIHRCPRLYIEVLKKSFCRISAGRQPCPRGFRKVMKKVYDVGKEAIEELNPDFFSDFFKGLEDVNAKQMASNSYEAECSEQAQSRSLAQR